jgi:putative FmdB family regulatory protein
MPLYAYKCPLCRAIKDVLLKLSELDNKVECEDCALGMERQLSAPSSFVFDSGAVGSKTCSNKRG